jgi:methylated-DNA-[protein]-cysteine S-methyltransferase
LGEIFVAVTSVGVRRVHCGGSEASFLAELDALPGVDAIREPAAIAPVLQQIEAYCAGRRRELACPLDLTGQTPFQRRVLEVVQRIGWGEVLSYGEVAARVDLPRGARAVGGVMRQNPLPFLVPCHRVIASGDRLGGYGTRLEHKIRLLAMEGIRVEHGRVLCVGRPAPEPEGNSSSS